MSLENKTIDDVSSVKAEMKNIAGNENKLRNANSSQPRSSHDKKEKKLPEPRKNLECKPTTRSEFIENVSLIRKINKITTGGRRLSFSATVPIGNGKGVVGLVISKVNEIPDAIKKAIEAAH